MHIYIYVYIYIYIPIYISAGPPCGGHQAARHMEVITVNQSWQFCYNPVC